jgi:hypothetical protein
MRTKFRKDWFRRSSNIKVLPQKLERLYWGEGFVNSAGLMGSAAMICTASFIKISSGTETLLARHTLRGTDLINLLLILQNSGSRPKIKLSHIH